MIIIVNNSLKLLKKEKINENYTKIGGKLLMFHVKHSTNYFAGNNFWKIFWENNIGKYFPGNKFNKKYE